MRKGVVVGKFWPFHLGHDLMIKSALAALDHVTIIVANNTVEKNIKVGYQMWERYNHESVQGNISVYTVVDTTKPELDENGIAVDKEYLQMWCDRFRYYEPELTHVVSSDLYGKVLAEMMGVEWFPVDPDRITVPISGTKIRNDTESNWLYVVPEAKYDWAYKVAIVGAESTGKSTLVKSIQDLVDSQIVPEYGRTLSEAKNNKLIIDDFHQIVKVQRQMMIQAAQIWPIVISDTEAIITHLYAPVYLSEVDAARFNGYKDIDYAAQDVNLYIVMAPTTDWVDDGTRVMGKQTDRENFHQQLVTYLTLKGANLVVIDDNDWYHRTRLALNAILENKRIFQNKR